MPSGPKTNNPGRNTVHPLLVAGDGGWQHDPMPQAPRGLSDHGRKAWNAWMRSWWAYFWAPGDLPGLELTVRLFDAVATSVAPPATLVPLLDRYGITPKGRQDLRWVREIPKVAKPEDDEVAARRQTRRGRVS